MDSVCLPIGVPYNSLPPHTHTQTHPFLFVCSPTKITLIGAVLFSLQKNQYLPLQTNHLMLFYTVFIVVNKVSLTTGLAPKNNGIV